jgi:dihydroneopterin aldolase
LTIHIKSLTIEGIIGILDFERINKQKIVIDIESSYLYREEIFINYADMINLVETHILLKEYKLLEDALIGLRDTIITTYSNIDKLYIKISKPDIIKNAIVSLSDEWRYTPNLSDKSK